MDFAIDLSDASRALDLANIRFQLMQDYRDRLLEHSIIDLLRRRLEDTIIFHLIERVQFPLNAPIYQPGGVAIPDTNLSLLDWILREHERIHSRVRRYQAPDEYPFFPDVLQDPILKPLNYPQILHTNSVDVNQELKSKYISDILPQACRSFGREDRGESKENYGSSATSDVLVLQALSRRIHFGKFVAESKFREEPERFVALIKAKDRAGIDAAITNSKVEKMVLDRLKIKARTYGTDPGVDSNHEEKIDVDAVASIYEEIVIPLTKVVEVEYLMQRLEGTKWGPSRP